jgi:hypothetical protein
MKQTKLLCLFMGILLTFTACQEDDIEFTREKSGTVTSRLINYDELKAMPKAMAKLQKIKEEKLKKSVYNERYDFTVDTTEVLLIEIGDYHSLTFSIIRDSTYDDTVENLVLNWEPYDDYLAFKAEYNLTEEEKDKIRNNEHVDLTNKERLTILFSFVPETVLKFNGGGNEEQIEYIDGECRRGRWVRVRSSSSIPGQIEYSEWRWVYEPVPCPEENIDHSWTEGNNPGGSGGTHIPVFNTPYPTSDNPVGENTLPGGGPIPHNSIITLPKVDTKAIATPKECKKINAILNITGMRGKLTTIATHVNDANDEYGFATNSDSTFTDFTPAPEITFTYNNTSVFNAVSHTHNLNKLSVFSFSDLVAIAKMIKEGSINTDQFIATLSTAKGTHYILTINNVNKYKAFFYHVIKDFGDLPVTERTVYRHSLKRADSLMTKYYNSKTGLIRTTNNNNTFDLFHFMNLLKEADLGVSMFETDANFQSLNQIGKLDSYAPVKRLPCQ